ARRRCTITVSKDTTARSNGFRRFQPTPFWPRVNVPSMVRKYEPSGKVDAVSLSLLVAAALSAALIGGAIEGFASRWFNLLVVFPAGLGLLVGGVGSAVVQRRRIRSPHIGLAVGLLM